MIMSIIIPIQGNSVLGRGPLQWTRSTASDIPPSPPLSSISIVSSAGTAAATTSVMTLVAGSDEELDHGTR